MNEEQYNFALCEERHKYIKDGQIIMDARMKKVENRFLTIVTTLALNLIGVISILAVLLLKLGLPK